MNKKLVKQLNYEKVVKKYPITDLVEGWFFSISETSNGVFLVEGIDLYSRKVARTGLDISNLLSRCAADAVEINFQINSK